MSAVPWTTEHVDKTLRFTNATGAKAVAITVQGLGTDYNDAAPNPVENGDHFDVPIDDRVTVYRIFWNTSQPPNRQYEWDYTV